MNYYYLKKIILNFVLFHYLIGWRPGSEYKYAVRGRTLTALHQVKDQYAGIVLRAQLTIQAKTESILLAKVCLDLFYMIIWS